MKYIEKDYSSSAVQQYEQELKEAQFDRESLSNPEIHKSCRGGDIYDMVKSMTSFNNLRLQMLKDQGNICCYCGRRLFSDKHSNSTQYVVEHVVPKSLDRTLAGEYGNMLLSCRMLNIKKGDAEWDADSWHCDKSKENKQLHHTPLDVDCGDYYSYDVFGHVNGKDEDTRCDIDILNLNAKYLTELRVAAIEGELFDENANLLSDEELRSRLDTIMNTDINGWHSEFCFAIAGAIRNVLEP